MDTHRRAKIILQTADVRRLLGLPDDVRIVAARAETDPLSIHVLLESDRFDEIPVDAEAPVVHRVVPGLFTSGAVRYVA